MLGSLEAYSEKDPCRVVGRGRTATCLWSRHNEASSDKEVGTKPFHDGRLSIDDGVLVVDHSLLVQTAI